MTVSVRSYLSAGLAATVVGAVALSPVQPSTPTAVSTNAVQLAAAAQPLVSDVNAAAATLGVATPGGAAQQPTAQASATANNAASNAVDAIYQLVMPYVDYWALELGPYLLGWVPFGYLIADQLYIWYPNFTAPLTYTTVYEFIDPVLNDFWNPTVWRDGLTAVANTARYGLGAVVNSEIAYFWSLQWFPFPLPPLPPLPFAAVNVANATAQRTPGPKPITEVSSRHTLRPQAVEQTSEIDETVAEETDTDEPVTAEPVTAEAQTPAPVTAKALATDKTAKADGKATSGTSAKSGADTGKKKSTAGSARTHGKAAKGDG